MTKKENPAYAKPKEEFGIRILIASLESVFEDPGNEEKDKFVKKRFLVVVVLGGLFKIRDHIVDAVVSARILEVSLVFSILNRGERKVLHVMDVARTCTELELAPAVADAAPQTITHLCVSSEMQNALLRLGCCGICNRCCLGISGMLTERPTPYNQDAADALKALLTPKLTSMLKD
nr:DnaJ homolog subfamily C GRV2 [Tanacetum cinerariifolium]